MKCNENSSVWIPFALVFFFLCVCVCVVVCVQLSFRAVNSISSLNDFLSGYVCCSWICLDARECFLF